MLSLRLSGLMFMVLLTYIPQCEAEEKIHYAGATTLQRFFIPEVAGHFVEATGLSVRNSGGNTTPGIKALLEHKVNLAGAGRHLTESEKQQGLIEHFLGWDILAIVVHQSNPVQSLTEKQLQGIFSGQIKSWREVGGPGQPIALINSPEGSGMRRSVQELILKGKGMHSQEIISPSVADCDQLVSMFPTGITALSRSMVDALKVKTIQVEGIDPTPEALKNGTYTYAKPLALVTNGPPGRCSGSICFSSNR